jgi:hypothetical protein
MYQTKVINHDLKKDVDINMDRFGPDNNRGDCDFKLKADIMKISMYLLVKLSFVAGAALVLQFFVISCSSSKHAVKEAKKTEATKEDKRDERITQLQHDSADYERRIREMEYLGVTVKEQPCDTAAIRRAIQGAYKEHDCPAVNIDSIIHSLAPKPTKFKKNADGSLEVEGQIASIIQSKTKLEEENQSLKRTIATLLQSTATNTGKITTVESKKDKTSTSSFLNQWWLFPLGVLVGLAIAYRKKLYSLFNIKTSSMKSVSMFLVAACCMLLGSCGHYPGGVSVWSMQMWMAPTLTAIGAALSGWAAYRSWKSGTTVYSDWKYHDEKGRIPLYKIGFFWYSVVLTVATIVIIIAVNWEK